ncbi:family 43 glycosylhydrolase [Marinilabilia sp.]|uniref:family 43 glycosylhydrolase n=1 Tax=Marinilabilia sp. TaxID=2021252 RepID=UPI0025C3509E|nr:family 43 glycosylhydrolase [Marinilabilia sp.]
MRELIFQRFRTDWKKISGLLGLIFCWGLLQAQDVSFDSPEAGNPLLPGYFADPTVKKFGDTWYLYTTTDGIKLASGEPQVWISKDFVNWFNYEMELDVPEGLTNVWAPDVVEGKDGQYYYFMGNCQFGCNIYGYVSESPMGPWKPVNDGNAVIEVGTGLRNIPALDAQFLKDDNGSVFSWFGTWCHLFDGIGWAEIDPGDMSTILRSGGIPMEQVPEAFEAAYPLKRNGKYFLMYSSGDCRLSSYAVHYSVSEHPEGPYRYGENSPILQSSSDGTIDSPGHHSVLKENDQYYIVYHRHDNPHSSGGMFRQVCADPLVFNNDSIIQKVNPSHKGVGFFKKPKVGENLAQNASVSATSFYHLVSKKTRFSNGDIDHKYSPGFATDTNNGTLWKSASAKLPQSLVLDLGKVKNMKRVMTRFEYPTFYYQYKIETSTDSITWSLFADKTNNRRSGSPMIDDHEAVARYVKLTVTGTEKTGLLAAVWEVEIYDALFDVPAFQNPESFEGPGVQSTQSCIANLDAESLKAGQFVNELPNKGAIGGHFKSTKPLKIEEIDGVKAFVFDGEQILELSEEAPGSMSWNAPYTVAAWVKNPQVGENECIATWTSRENMLMGSYSALMYGTGRYGAVAHGDGYVDLAYVNVPEEDKWHHISLVFDGMKEVLYVNGEPVIEQPISLFVENSRVIIGGSGFPQENFSGYISTFRLFDKPMKMDEVEVLMNETRPRGIMKVGKE